ncbi:MAG: hypothetical protein HYW23_03280, partial [Candidatus Aenigmarchaeota archaeon]|nr:hypothetical protein [Candidatus Aenigmarchaeota archaeon]
MEGDAVKVLLVYPHYTAGGLDGLILSPPLGLLSIGTMIKDLCDVKILDLKANHLEKHEIEKEIEKFQ